MSDTRENRFVTETGLYPNSCFHQLSQSPIHIYLSIRSKYEIEHRVGTSTVSDDITYGLILFVTHK